MGDLAVGVDIGGTNIALAVVDAEHRVVRREKVRTPEGGPDAVVRAVLDGLAELGEEVGAVGVGAPGPVDDGVVLVAPNLEGWTEPVALGQQLSAALGVPVAVENDATAGAVGEWIAGAGQGARHLVGVWLGTGVGGGLVLDDRPYRGAWGAAGELGHVIVSKGGALCGCGRHGCLEAYAGRASMETALRAAIDGGEASVVPQLMREKGKTRMTSSVWAAALDAGDALTVRLLDGAVEAIAVGVASAVNLLDLDTIVIGGGLAEKLGADLVERIATAARPLLLVGDRPRRWELAALGDDAGVVGAAAVARTITG